MFDDDYTPTPYKPVPQVVAAHNIPHLTRSVTTADNSFRFYNDQGQVNMDYFMSTAGLPIIIIALGILSLISYQLTLCFRFCCKCCCQCCKIPTVPEAPNEKGFYWLKTFRHYPRLMSAFHIALIGAIVVDFCIYFGNGYLTVAFHKGGDALDSLALVFSNVIAAGDDLISAAAGLMDSLESQACSEVFGYSNSSLTDHIGSFNSSAGSVTNVVGNFPDTIHHARDTFLSYGPKKDQVLFLYFAFILFFLICFFLVPCCGSKWALNTLIFFTELVILTLIIISGIEMVIVVLLGDFCMSPADSVATILNNGSGTSLLNYYLKCEGENEFFEPLHNASSAIYDFNATLYQSVQDIRQQSGNATVGEVCLESVELEVINIIGSLEELISTIMCRPIYHVWDQAVNQSFCKYAFPGLFSIWLCHLLTGFFLFVLLISVSWFHDVFSPTRVSPDEHQDVVVNAAVTTPRPEVEMVVATPIAPEVAPKEIVHNEPAEHHHQQHHHHHHHDGLVAVEPSNDGLVGNGDEYAL